MKFWKRWKRRLYLSIPDLFDQPLSPEFTKAELNALEDLAEHKGWEVLKEWMDSQLHLDERNVLTATDDHRFYQGVYAKGCQIKSAIERIMMAREVNEKVEQPPVLEDEFYQNMAEMDRVQ